MPNADPGGQNARDPVRFIGITCDLSAHATSGRLIANVPQAYADAVAQAGGVPILLPPCIGLVPVYARECHAFVFSGGDDPKMEMFGEPTHPKATLMHTQRQEFEVALLTCLAEKYAYKPVLGVCLGMQLMCLHAGGKMNQHLADNLPTHAAHKNTEHRVTPSKSAVIQSRPELRFSGMVWSNHRQAITQPGGTMETIATSDDKVIEAVACRERPWYVGVQWHPERTTNPDTGAGLILQLVRAATRYRMPQ
jgi:gamma-glutamyl-gamma-aminobutyrate hydrolase PuuD